MLTFARSAYFHELLNSFSAGVVICNIRGLIYESNTAALHILGCTREELANPDTVRSIASRVDDPRVLARFLAGPLKHSRVPAPIRVAHAHPSEGGKHLSLSCSILVEFDKVFGIMVQITDVTEIYHLHEQERRLLLERNAVQQERIEGLNKFSLAVAHQIRNPLTVIGGFVGRMLRKRGREDPEYDALCSVMEGAKRLEEIVKAVGDFARRPVPRVIPVDPTPLLAVAKERAEARAGHIPAKLAWTLAIEPARVMVDPALFIEAVTELLVNALEAQAGGAAVLAVSMRQEADMVRLTVADAGPGLDEISLPYAFDPFFTTKAVGVGMGLCLARRDVEEMGGSVVLANSAQGGAVATITLPRRVVRG